LFQIEQEDNGWKYNIDSEKVISSKVGKLGVWSEIESCGKIGIIVGFHLRVHEDQGVMTQQPTILRLYVVKLKRCER